MIKINFIHHTARTVIKGNGILYMRISGLDKELNISTNINVPKNDWDSKKEVIKSRNEQAYQFNKCVSDLKNKIYSFVESKSKNNELISAQMLKNHLKGKEEQQITFLSLFDYHLTHNASSLVKNTIMQYKSTKAKLSEYLKAKLLVTDITLDRLNYRFISDFKVFLEVKYHNHQNTINKDIQRLKTVIHLAQKLEWLNDDPFKNFSTKTVATKRSILSFEEISRIELLDIENETERIVRDGFLLMCYTGLSYSDLASLKAKDIQISITGKKVIKINRNKTDEFCIIPVIDKANEIINAYQNNPLSLSTGKVIPTISNQKMNEYLKVIASKTNIDKLVTCHVARHSFATNSLELNVPIETVSKVLGHTSIKTTQIYAKITETKLMNDFAAFETNLQQQTLLHKAI